MFGLKALRVEINQLRAKLFSAERWIETNEDHTDRELKKFGLRFDSKFDEVLERIQRLEDKSQVEVKKRSGRKKKDE